MSCYGIAGYNLIQYVPYAVKMRVNPTIGRAGTWNVANCSQPSSAGQDESGFCLYTTTTATGMCAFNNSAPATQYIEMLGAEL